MKKFRWVAVIFLLAVPVSMRAQTVAVHGIQLLWSAPAPTTVPVASYNVYRSTVSGTGYVKIGNIKVGSGLFLDTTGTSGTTYFYVVTSVDGTGLIESGFSNQASAIFPKPAPATPPVPPNLRATPQ